MTVASQPETTLVLASASPARLSVLRAAGLAPVVVVSDVDEDAVVQTHGVNDPVGVARLLAEVKARNVAEQTSLPPGAVIVGCDSVLELDGQALGKPGEPHVAIERWQRMRGRWGVLHTGHCVVDLRPEGADQVLVEVCSTKVHFADLSDDEIEAYVATGEPLNVAGSFTLDGLGGAYVTEVHGDPSNVIGISLPLLRTMFRTCGVPWHSMWLSGTC